MAVHESTPNEGAVNARMRRQQVANSLLILVLAAGFVAIAAIAYWWSKARTSPSAPAVQAKASVVAPAPPATPRPAAVAVPAAPPVRSPKPTPPVPKPTLAPMRPAAAQLAPSSVEERSEVPEGQLQPPANERPALEYPNALAANRLLYSIKCFDGLAYEGESRGRHRYSALCKSGARKQVSCKGASCRIEYAPPPSHLP
jgi:hypothetical protein